MDREHKAALEKVKQQLNEQKRKASGPSKGDSEEEIRIPLQPSDKSFEKGQEKK